MDSKDIVAVLVSFFGLCTIMSLVSYILDGVLFILRMSKWNFFKLSLVLLIANIAIGVILNKAEKYEKR